jgi:transposase
MNVLDVTDRDHILNLLRLGWGIRRVERETGHRHETIRRYGIEAGVLAQQAGPKCTTRAEVPTDSKSHTAPEVPTGSTSRSSAEPFREFIKSEFEKGRNAKSIFQDLVLHRGYSGSYDAVKRLARKLRKHTPRVSCRFETEPGQEAQVDYGEGAPARDPRTGKYRKPRLFVMTLGNSRHAFRKVIWKSSTEIWCRLHEEAFAYFGGATQTIRLDNLKEGVLKPDIWDPQLNPLYAKMLSHYGVIALPCRPYSPDLKGKVESAVGYTQKTALKGKRFESIEEENVHLARWNEHCAATRIHGTTKGRCARCSRRSGRILFRCRRRALNITASANERCTSTGTSKSIARTTRRHLGTSAAGWWCTWGGCGCASSIGPPTNACVSTRSRCRKANGEPTTPIDRNRHLSRLRNSPSALAVRDLAARRLPSD